MTSCQGAKGTGTLYSYAQLEGLWINAGGPSAAAPVAAAIAMAESGGCSTAYNPSGATGLWQILGAVNPADQAGLTSPAVNAREAVLKYQGAGNQFTPWVTYTSGAYRGYVSGGTTPDLSAAGGAAAAQTTALVGGCDSNCLWCVNLGSIAAGCLLSKSQGRAVIAAGLLAAGGVAGLVGVLILAVAAWQGTGAGRAAGGALDATGAAVAAVPGGEGAGLAIGAAGATARRGAGESLQRRRGRREAAERDRQAAAAKAAKAGP